MGRRFLAVLFLGVGALCAIGALSSAQMLTGPAQLERCDEGLFTISFANPDPAQTSCQIVVANTPPSSQFAYVGGSGTVTIPGMGTYPADPVHGSWSIDAITGSAYELPPGGTITVQFHLSTTCLAVSGTDAVAVSYVNCAQPGTPLQALDSMSIEILPGDVTVTSAPAVTPAGVGDLVTWTLSVHSTGLGSIKNIVAIDTLGPGLEFVSAKHEDQVLEGQVLGQTITWDSTDIAELSDMAPDTSQTITLVARVVACTGLGNSFDAQFGCGMGQVCDDTMTDPDHCGNTTATSSVAFVARLPFLQFTAPAITIPYCATTTTVTIPITNTGDGTAHDATLCPTSLDSLVVSNVQGGARYEDGCFHLPDIAAGAPPYKLTFDVTFTGNWCVARPSESPLYTLDYKNDCGVLHHASPQFGSIGASAAPGLSVSKTGPSIVQFGTQVTYNIAAVYSGPASCGGDRTGIVTVTDNLPAGFTVVASAGGVWTPGTGGTGGTVTWTFDPTVTASSSWALIVQVPLDCGFCYTEQTNTVTASATSCCGCALSASTSATMAITCERLYTSTFTVSPAAVLERCGDAVTVTDGHTFADDAGLDAIRFGDFVYSFIKENGLAYVPGSATAMIDGTPTTVTVIDGPTTIQLTATDPRPVRKHTLVFTYGLRATSASTPACGGASSFYVWASHEIPTIGPCTLFYDTALLTVEPPAMSVGISGVPTIQEDCATYAVTITFRRTSSLAVPYDARLVLTGISSVIADFASATWSGVTPSEPPIVGPNSIEWRFADGFSGAGATATVTVPVTARCGGPLIGLSAQATYDDRCDDIVGYNNTCSTSASAAASLHLSGDVHITMTPEVVYTTQRSVTWRIELYNSSNGTARNVYVDDILGSGLAYASSSASRYSGSLSTQANLNHTSGAINGASFLFEKIAPGERPVILLTANLVACHDMTNEATVGWGCGGSECQPTRSDSSYVIVAPAGVVSTSFAPTPIDACTTQKATMTLRSSGIGTAYNLTAMATIPTGLVYVGNPEYRVSGGAWLAAGAPSGLPGPALTWDKTQVAALGAVAPGVTIDIRFDVQANCSFGGGTLQARTSYESPCGQTFLSSVGTFAIASRTPNLSLTTAQTFPTAGQPIACGNNVTWEIRVTNNGPAAASAIWVEDTLGAGLTCVSSTGGADGGYSSGQTTTWEIVGLGVGSTAVVTVTAQATSCGALTSSAKAYWACGPDGMSSTPPDCLSTSYASASATATRVVTVTASASLSPSSIGACASGTTFTLTLSNTSTSAPAYSPDAKVTLPFGLTYRTGTTEINCGGGFVPAADPVQAGQVLTWYNTAATGTGNDLCDSIPASGSIAVRFQVNASCYRMTASAAIDLYYYDCCGGPQYHVTTSSSLTAAPPTLLVTMTPTTATLDCANLSSTVTWTITVNNTGQSTAGFIRVVDTLGADLVRVSGGTQIGANPQQWGWEFGPVAAGGSQSVQFVARLAAPPNDCSVARRTSTTVTSWGCTSAALDGDPNTIAEYACASSDDSVTTTASVLVPDLSISSSDISPRFTCSGDGISNGRMLLTVHNTGTAAITTDFAITFSESTTLWSGGGSFTSLGGTLPLATGGSQVLTFTNWPIACSSCSYQFTASLDTGGVLCECRENNNTATLNYTPTSPDLAVASSTLAPSCAGDGQVRIQGNVTLRNQGCGSSSFTTNVPMRFTVYAGASCSGTVLDQWTQTFTGVSLAAGGGTQAFAVDRTTTYNACSACQISILIEADYSNAICECSGTNNTLCAGPLTISFPDLIVSGIDFAGVTCASDAIAGSVAVTVTNQGCDAAGAFNVGLSTSGCLTFSARRVTSLAAGASVVVQFPIATTWSGCGTCGCTFTATADTSSEVCECNGANNTGTASYTSTLPDLVISALTASAASPCQPGSAQVTVRNSGCGIAPSGVVVGITGAVTGQASTTVALAAGESQTVTVPFAAAVGCGSGYSVTATIDPSNAVCECNGANNTASTTFSVSAPDLTVLNLAAACNLDDTFTVTATVRNLGGQAATSASIRVYADGTLVHEEAQSIASGATYSLSYVTPALRCATAHAIRVVADEANAICECSEANNEATTNAALCACPALSIQKAIINVWRRGVSVWPTTAVEPGDVIEYEAAITNNGAAIAFHVDLADALPAGLVYETAAPGHGGQYVLTADGSGTFPVPVGGSSFTTAIHATLPISQAMRIRYCALAQSSLEQGDILTNTVTGSGQEGNGNEIPTGSASATTTARRPGFEIEKTITDVLRNGTSIGTSGPVEPGDVIAYRATMHNVGGGTAYNVELHDALPSGLVYESAGSYAISAPATSGSLGAVSGATSFQTGIHATLAGGATLTATYSARATSAISGAAPLVNTVSVTGDDGAGTPVPVIDSSISDTFPDAATASTGSAKPALAVDKIVADVRRGGSSIGVVDPLLYGDVIVYLVTVRNVGRGIAYSVNLVDALPAGIVVDTSTPLGGGTFAVSAPAASGGLGLADGSTGFSAAINATIAGTGTLTVSFAARVTASALPSVPLTNTATGTGKDGSSSAIPEFNTTLGDTYADTGTASVRVGSPALVTEKRIDRVVRDGHDVAATTLEVGDVVTYALVVRNVGQAPAYGVSLVDVLPTGLSYRGASSASWPGGSSTAAPQGLPGQTLTWPLAATLGSGEEVVLTFEATASGPIGQGATYTNTLFASGKDASGAWIPADNHIAVPGDTDLDDSSAVSIRGAQPALVTHKRVVNVVRNGQALGPSLAIEAGDVVTFELTVSNVGLGNAYAVDVRDELPTPFTYVSGSTAASWAARSAGFDFDPSGAPRPSLSWPMQADLPPGSSLTLRFAALIGTPIPSGSSYRNVFSAAGLDGSRAPIPANNAGNVPADTDEDDQDAVVLTAVLDQPALVTSKAITRVERAGRPVFDDRIEFGDTIDYELVVENVGPATAYAVNVADTLPREFSYVPGSTTVTTPSGFSSADPRVVGEDLVFDVRATLARNEEMVLRFEAVVTKPIIDGRSYVNDMLATGVDRTGVSIPADQHRAIPADTDFTDSSSASIRGRSWLAEGAGGIVNVPILRKTAETLEAGGCLGSAAVVDRVWFQTDIALFAANEFAAFAEKPAPGDLLPDTLLPTWARTVRGDIGRYALENLLQVDTLSDVGVDLAQSPRILATAGARQISADQAVSERLADLSRLAGITTDDLVPDSRWIYLEAEAGEPIFQAARDTAWGENGTWTTVIQNLVGSSLGMGLVRQAQAASSLLTSPDAKERYIGWVLAEIMAGKLVALDQDLTVRPESGPSYLPHVSRALATPSQFEVTDGASVLFDQVSLLWGAARVIEFVQGASAAWPESERELATTLETGARTILSRAAVAIATYHIAADGRIAARSPAAAGGVWVDASTVDVGLLVVAVREALGVAGDTADALRSIQGRAVSVLESRQGSDGRFAEVSQTAGVSTDLSAQFAGIYGLLAVDRVAAANRTFDFLESHAWDDWKGFGLYRMPDDTASDLCYTALDMGLAVGALRELAARADPDRCSLATRRLAAFVRTVLDDAALQLDNAGDASRTDVVAGNGRGTIFGLKVADASRLAPVLQRSLCLVDNTSGTSCGGLRILPHSPWYQTDIAMYASYILQASDLGREDDADANLAAVDFHSGLGVSFDAYPSLAGLAARTASAVGSSAALEPIVVPFYAGDPYLGDAAASGLAWDPASFDERIVPSALGMTLLRESQEVSELAAKTNRSPEDELAARLLVASVAGKLGVLESLVREGPNGVHYIPHAFLASQAAGSVTMQVEDSTSDLFDQASLLLGLTQTLQLARDAAAAGLLAAVSVDATSLAARSEALVDTVLGTLEAAHRRAGERILANLATPKGGTWIPGDAVSTYLLGLAAEALEKVQDAFGQDSSLSARAQALLEEEVAFLRSTLWDGSGGYRETWMAAPSDSETCRSPSLTGQLGAVRALLAWNLLHGGATDEIRSALLAFDSRFWDPSTELYVSQLDHLDWCMTPLDLAYAIDVIPQALPFVGTADAQTIMSHLVRHVDRALDAVDLQIPARRYGTEGQEQRYAPVFDRRVCLEPTAPLAGLTWTQVGDLVRYTVQAENPTDVTFIHLTLNDVLPEGVSLIATNPAAAVDGLSLRWVSDRLEPGATLTWTIDVRVPTTAALGDVLTNCATLTCTDEAGVACPPREACASVTLGNADGARAAGLRSVSVSYRTDEAMRLAVALEDLADQGTLGATQAEAQAMSLANLGVLLGESGLGVPFSLSPSWASPDEAAASLSALAERAGLPGLPDLEDPIFLPSAGGVPILERGSGFTSRNAEITPAAIGWTMAREAQALDSTSQAQGGLAGYLTEFVSLALKGQLAWLNGAGGSYGTATRFVHGVKPTVTESGVLYDVTDPRSLAYDQASLLAGLARVAASHSVDAESVRLAGNIASDVLSDLARHVGSDGTLSATLDAGSEVATWFVAAVTARALSEVATDVPRLERQAEDLLARIARPARNATPTDPKEKAARIELLLVAARSLSNSDLRDVGLAAWENFIKTSIDRSGRIVFSAPALLGWRYSPAELALAFELLGEVERAKADLADQAKATAVDLLRVDVLAKNVQLWEPLGYWQNHIGLPCFGAAPVFAVRPGPPNEEQIWTLRRL